MRQFAGLLATFSVLTCAGALAQEGFQPLGGEGIRAALTDARVDYTGKDQGAWQEFFADGRTLYGQGAGQSWGRWFLRGDQYCSTWPPSEHESCYRVARDAARIRFLGAGGAVFEGELK